MITTLLAILLACLAADAERVLSPSSDGTITLAAQDAMTHGEMLRYEPQPNKNTLGYWTQVEDWAGWRFKLPRPGRYEVHVLQGCGQGQGGSQAAVKLGGQELKFMVEDTGHFQNFKDRALGTVSLESGEHALELRPVTKAAKAVMDVRLMRLIPVLPEPMAAYYQPPEQWSGKLGEYRSPLLMDDGTPVNFAPEWPKRREELLKYWHGEMGPWPEIIESPRVEVLREEQRDGLTWRRVRVEIATKQTSEGWLLIPEGKGPFPAVLVVYYEPETSVGLGEKGKEYRDFGLQLAKRGFVTLNIGTPGGNAWKPELNQALCQPLSYHAYVAANCWQALAGLPQVDRERIGVTGHSYGGKWALFAGALWEKFAAVAVSDPGIVFDEKRANVNYWEPWYLGKEPSQTQRKAGIPSEANPRTGAYKRMREAGRDLQELHALISPRPFLVSGGAEDKVSRWEALNHAVAVNKVLGYSNRVGMTNRPDHSPNAESNEQLFAFFEHFLNSRKAE